MKKLLIITGAMLCCAGAFAQGSLTFALNSDNLIYFTTDIAKLNSADQAATFSVPDLGGPFPVAGSLAAPDGSITAVAGTPTFIAALFAGTSSTSLSLQTTTSIDTWGNGAPGAILPVTANMLSPFAAGAPAWFQVQVYQSGYSSTLNAWGTAGTYAGYSGIFQSTPLVVPDFIWSTAAPVNSTWGAGTQSPVDMEAIGGAGSAFGGIALANSFYDAPIYSAVPEPQSK